MSVIHHRRLGTAPSAPTWTYAFAFGQGEAANVSYETTMHSSVDDSVTTFVYAGNEVGSNFPGAASLLLKQKKIRDASNAVVHQEDYQYQDVAAPAATQPFFQYYTPEMTRRDILRAGRRRQGSCWDRRTS